MNIPKPAFRKLRGYAFDPSVSLRLDTVGINTMLYKIRWEEELQEGPSGEYFEVVDYDPTVPTQYARVNLNLTHILADDGLAPSEGNPMFHQQMVYAVAMLTVQNFEKALGRKIIWSSRLLEDKSKYEEYVGKIRLYPHALREANAYYSPLKKAILFGYFSASPATITEQMPGSLVFTCLSHDIIAHEVTHAILDGIHRNYNKPTNPDVLAFHEAFSDIVALFQHFSFPEVLNHQIARTRGELEKQNLLGQLAQQFGVAIGKYGSLRDALGSTKDGKWTPAVPDPAAYQETMEPHERGSILVAAVFDAFLLIYKRRVQDLLRIASGGTGILPEGELHPDLVNRLANEAAKTASHVLTMCIRALDYCPPVDITFGDYLRGIITADADVVADDKHNYRLAFLDAFRRRGIYPDGIQTLSEESLRYSVQDQLNDDEKQKVGIISEFLRGYRQAVSYLTKREDIWHRSREFIRGAKQADGGWAQGLHMRLTSKFGNSSRFENLTGLVFNDDCEQYGVERKRYGANFQIQNLRLVSRVGPDLNQVNQIVLSLVQRMTVAKNDGGYCFLKDAGEEFEHFELEGGCTLIFDLDGPTLKYAIGKPLVRYAKGKLSLCQQRIGRLDRFVNEEMPLHLESSALLFGDGHSERFGEPFCLLHRG
ncbi:MAG: hypothetical protein KF760_30845 [Candidatus Eremiobacteraeota bacterium]|nr:hypothetical protein [Candidatus Eremiobacteraeota bacterium]MCW5871239.1 hypothetical protein [Candidatus Eremiobacteraeota bacterium]